MTYYMGDLLSRRLLQGDPGFFFIPRRASRKKPVGLIPGVGPIAKGALDLIPTGGSKMVKMAQEWPSKKLVLRNQDRQTARCALLCRSG